jgi:hypothetical protein
VNPVEALIALLVEVDKLGVRSLVAGWNCEGRSGVPHRERHPSWLGATLITNCGDVYKLDEAIKAAHAALDGVTL